MRIFCAILSISALYAETGRDAWLRYAPLDFPQSFSLPPAVILAGDSPVVMNARNELIQGVHGMLGRVLRVDAQPGSEGAMVLGTVDELRAKYPQVGASLDPQGFRIQWVDKNLIIAGADPSGVLYGTFAALRQIATTGRVKASTEAPRTHIRWVNQWDNLDGTIERGYGGRSIFWDKGTDPFRFDACFRIRPVARVGGYQCVLGQQRERQHTRHRHRDAARVEASG